MKHSLLKRFILMLACVLLVVPAFITSEVSAGKLKPDTEKYTPGQWYLGDTPPNYSSSKPPVVFVQGKNGNATNWYGETVYHGVNDMYTKFYEAGYQTVFVQLYDAAGEGSETQYKNGQLLATMLKAISQRFNGQKVNIVAHSKGGPDTQAALIHYGAHQYVGKVITLGSPHYGSELADLSYSWYAGWLGSLLGQNDPGTYSLQVGEMAKFRTATDSHANRSKNKYYTVAGTNKGPTLSALALGGAYLSSYGANDGLVTVTSSKLPYGTHLFTDSTLDHDNIRVGSKVFSRIESYLRNSTVTASVAATNYEEDLAATSLESPVLTTDSSNYITGGNLSATTTTEKEIYVPATTSGTISVLTASDASVVEVVSPSGVVTKATTTVKDDTILTGANVYSVQLPTMEEGTWTVKMKATTEQDAYLLIASFDESSNITLQMANEGTLNNTPFTLTVPTSSEGVTSYSVKMVDANGKEVKQTVLPKFSNKEGLNTKLPTVTEPGVYNVTMDVMTKYPNGKVAVRTIVRSIHIQ
jgi:triacylglycerol esterase/lipase EstA (alpha/beta hydrolase family)